MKKKLRRKSSDFIYPTEGNQDTAYITCHYPWHQSLTASFWEMLHIMSSKCTPFQCYVFLFSCASMYPLTIPRRHCLHSITARLMIPLWEVRNGEGLYSTELNIQYIHIQRKDMQSIWKVWMRYLKKKLRFSVLDPSPLRLQGILVALILKGPASRCIFASMGFFISAHKLTKRAFRPRLKLSIAKGKQITISTQKM